MGVVHSALGGNPEKLADAVNRGFWVLQNFTSVKPENSKSLSSYPAITLKVAVVSLLVNTSVNL